ncbi:MAG: LuxR family transcriptional regulator, partial [Nitrospira sp.]|nr:LuxR family transcriptional regulator [Nitrospira sp.]
LGSVPVKCRVSEVLLHKTFPFILQGGQLARLSHARMRPEARPTSLSGLPSLQESPPPFPSRMLSDLTKAELQQVIEILHYTMEASTDEDVHRILQLLQQAIPCTKVIGGVAAYTPTGSFKEFSRVLNVSYSNDWLYVYCKNEYATVDPVLLHLPSSLPTLIWRRTFAAVTSSKQREFIEEASSFGLASGITTAQFDRKRGIATFFSFAGIDESGTMRYQPLIEYLVPHFHRVLATTTTVPLSDETKGLSPREITVLLWMKEGKSNWEIAHIIGIRERTVRFHVESIFVKLNACSRTQAVAVAMEHGLLPQHFSVT